MAIEVIECCIVRLEKGQLDYTNAYDLEKEIKQWLNKRSKRILVDLSNVEMISSLGMGILLAAHREALRLQSQIRLFGVTPEVMALFKIANLDQLIPINDTMAEAVYALG